MQAPPSSHTSEGVSASKQATTPACIIQFRSPPADVKGTLPCYLDVPLKGQSVCTVCTHRHPVKRACCWQPVTTDSMLPPLAPEFSSVPISTHTSTNEESWSCSCCCS
jgi:hypothetical protein